MTKFLRVGKIIKPQGINGEAKVYSTSSDAKRFDMLKYVYLIKDDDNEKDLSSEPLYHIKEVKYLKNAVVIRFDGIDKIEKIEKYIGCSLYIKREDAISLDKNEYFVADIIGMDVIDIEKKLNGKVVDAIYSDKSSTLVIKTDDKEILIPMAIDYIKHIDFDHNLITIKLIEGILDI